MQLIGFAFTKIVAERIAQPKPHGMMDTRIEFKKIEKDENMTLLKEQDALNISFSFSILYLNQEKEGKKETKNGEISLEGTMILALPQNESAEILKRWKKKEIAQAFKIHLYNIILRKCTIKALMLQEELGLPTHIPLPQFTPSSQQG